MAKWSKSLWILKLILSVIACGSMAFAETTAPAQKASDGSSAIGEVRSTLDQVVNIVEALPGDGNTKARRAQMREVIQPRFDFQEMAKRSLGSYWQQATADEQKEFVDVFSELLATTYLKKIETVKRGMVKIDSEKLDFPRSVVRTTVVSKGDSFPIEYKLQSVESAWKVYDVVIENIGLVANYRNEFAGIIRKEKIPGLLVRLREKAKQDA